jgi:hypothetical protein
MKRMQAKVRVARNESSAIRMTVRGRAEGGNTGP